MYAPVSVIIPCYQATSFLERAVNSVLDQTLLPKELLLVDDASPDGGKTERLIKYLAQKHSREEIGISIIPIFLGRNKGPGGARNAGWDIASQDWVAFLDADDAWHPDKIALQYKMLQDNMNVDLVAHQCAFIQSVDNLDSVYTIGEPINILDIGLGRMLISNGLPTRSVMLRKSIPLRFPEENRFSEDYFLWLKIIASGFQARLMKCVLAYTFRPEYSAGGYSGQLWTHEKRELNTLRRLFIEKHIKFQTFVLVCIWSVLKFMLRVIKVKFESLHPRRESF